MKSLRSFNGVLLTSLLLLRVLILLCVSWETINLPLFCVFINPVLALVFYWLGTKLTEANKWIFLVFALVIDSVLPFFGFFMNLSFFMIYKALKPFHSITEEETLIKATSDPRFAEFLRLKKAKLEEQFKTNLEEKLLQALQIEPYLDILRSQDTDLKLSVLDLLSKKESRPAIKLLRLALSETNYEVQFFANNALSKIEQEMMRRINNENINVSFYPNDFENYNKRGEAYLNFVKIEMVDARSAEYFLRHALSDFEKSLELNPAQEIVAFETVYIYLKLLSPEEALSKIKSLKFKDPLLQAKYLLYRAEVYFKLREFSRMTEDLNEIDAMDVKFERPDICRMSRNVTELAPEKNAV